MLQAALTQAPTPFVELQTLPQEPQFCGSVSSLVSQPFAGSPSQSAVDDGLH